MQKQKAGQTKPDRRENPIWRMDRNKNGTLDFIDTGHNVILSGSSGTGKYRHRVGH